MTLWKFLNAAGFRIQIAVSILVFLDDALKVCDRKLGLIYLLEVSILVFLDDALKDDVIRDTTTAGEIVSILVFLDDALKGCPRSWQYSTGVVSILVFLDDALKGWNIRSRSQNEIQFQSLFFWMTLWKGRQELNAEVLDEFQSLFFWMTLWKGRCDQAEPRLLAVSILVFLDDALKVGGRHSPLGVYNWFQSLFFWMTLWKSG